MLYICIRINSPCQVRIACFNGKARYRVGKRKNSQNSFLGYSEKDLFDFAENAIALLRSRCPAFFADQIVRVDIFFDPVDGRLYVLEFESLEADIDPMESDAEVKKYEKLMTDLCNYWVGFFNEAIDYVLLKLTS